MAPEVFEFADVTVDLRRVLVLRSGQPVSLEPKSFEVLRYLLEHRDRLVTKEELLDAVWKDTFVTPNVLTRAIAQLRKALGDDAFEARYVETVAKRGYRFIAPLSARREPAPEPVVVPSPGAVSSTRPALPAAAVAVIAVLVAVIVGLAVVAFRDRAPAGVTASSPTPSLRRLTTGSHSYSFPSISPDGRTIAYSSDQTGAMEIYLSGLAPGSREIALTSDGGHNMYAAWSPDGQWIAYHSRRKGGIWIVPSGGGAARQVVDFGSQPSWTPDAERLVFTSDAGGMAAQSVLWSVDRNGEDRRQVTRLGAPRGGHSKPSVSPDGRLVAFTVSHGSISTEIWTAPLDGGTATKIGIGAGPRFSPDSRAVYWIGRTPEGSNDTLMRVAVDERGAPAGVPDTIESFPGSFAGGFSIARDSTAVLWLFRASANLWSVAVPQGDAAPSPPTALTFDDVRNTYPSHSSDGRITFHQFAVGQPPTTWVMSEDGGNRELLTVGLNFGVWGPQWPPGNTRLFVTTSAPDRKPAFAWLDLATRQISQIAPGDGALSARLSPDGRHIAFHVIDEGGVLNVWTQSLEGGPRKQITFDTEAMSYPMWSPDGKSLVIEIKRGDDTHMGVVSRDGGPVELIVTERGQSWPYSWAPDNDRIAFAGARDGVWNIYTVSRKTKQVKKLTDFASVEGYVRYPSWSRTRPAIVFERAEQRGSLWAMRLD
jgi:Tol biopolymer transport system component/DNA-binding winged helix-turn-helix (wHTH) protein